MNRTQLESFLRDHHREAFLWARQCCGFDGELAKDVIQQVYLKILEGKARLKHDSNCKTWLFTIIRFTAIDELRKSGKSERLDSEVEVVWAEPEADPETYEALVRRLPTRQQEGMLMVFYHEMTLEQTAEVLKLQIGTVRTHYGRGKKKLREWIEKIRVTQ